VSNPRREAYLHSIFSERRPKSYEELPEGSFLRVRAAQRKSKFKMQKRVQRMRLTYLEECRAEYASGK